MRLAGTALERAAIALASLALSVGLIALLSGFFAGRDQAGVGAGSAGIAVIGQAFPDLGHVHLRPGELRPVYNSEPPTSGAHIPEPVLRDGAMLDDNQLLQALEVGDVVIAYGTPLPPPGLAALARQLSEAFTPQLAASGQAVLTMRRPHIAGLIGLAWGRMLRVSSPADPRLSQFAEQRLGHGAPGR